MKNRKYPTTGRQPRSSQKGRLFFIALLPDEPIQEEITAFKLECARSFQSIHALKTPPHLTLIPPFFWQEERLPELEKALRQFAAEQQGMDVELSGFNNFPPKVIFVNVIENQQLRSLQAALFHYLQTSIGLTDEKGRRFHPHLTIAHRDLKALIFPQAWAHFSKIAYSQTFKANRITLLEHLKGRWEILSEHHLSEQ